MSLYRNSLHDASTFVAIRETADFHRFVYESGMLSEWLRKALEATGIGQSELSRQLTAALGRSVDRAAVNKMVNGTRGISADELKAIERITGWEAPTEIEQGDETNDPH